MGARCAAGAGVTPAKSRHGSGEFKLSPGRFHLIFRHLPASNAQIDSISSHSHTRIVSSTSSLFQSRCCTDGNRIYRHSQRPRHGGDDFQAVRPHLACCCAAHRFVLRRELKRRQKQREKEARRAENSANRPPPPNKDSTTDEVANEEDLSPNVRWLY